MDVLGTAVDRKLVGELALFRFVQDAAPHYALGQITEVQLRNPWHEDPMMRSLIRQRGRVDAVSERQDTHLAQMNVSAVFQERGPGRYDPSLLGTVPSTGTRIALVNDGVLNELLKPYADQIVYLGQVYGSTPKLPMWFKHFGSDANGAGEAYHLGIFGKSGSGKSVLAKLVLLGYARHTDMGIIIVDPQGEYADTLRRWVLPWRPGVVCGAPPRLPIPRGTGGGHFTDTPPKSIPTTRADSARPRSLQRLTGRGRSKSRLLPR